MKKKLPSILFVAVFFVICVVPTIGFFIFGPAETGANERLAAKPSLTERDGSINTDYRSYYLHLENGVLMYDREIAKEMREDFLQALDLSKEVTLEESRKVFIIIRLFRLLLHVMAPLF